MKQEKGITITSLIVYVIAMTVVIGIVATISSKFYGNMNELNLQTQSVSTYTKISSFITEEINTKNNIPIYPTEDDGEVNYIIFSETNNQYTFQESSIYLNKVKLCSNIKNCTFSYQDDKLIIKFETNGGEDYSNTYKIVNY